MAVGNVEIGGGTPPISINGDAPEEQEVDEGLGSRVWRAVSEGISSVGTFFRGSVEGPAEAEAAGGDGEDALLWDVRRDYLALFRVPYTDLPRRYPHLSLVDSRAPAPDLLDRMRVAGELVRQHPELLTRYPELRALSVEGEHGYVNSYEDEEILAVQPIVEVDGDFDRVPVYYTEDGRVVIQQQATRGCTAAVAAMLASDRLGAGSCVGLIRKLHERNLSNDVAMLRDLSVVGLHPRVVHVSTIDEMAEVLTSCGSVIAKVNSGAGGHVVVLDRIEEDRAVLRDPYHGWSIEIDRATFERTCHVPTTVIVANPILGS